LSSDDFSFFLRAGQSGNIEGEAVLEGKKRTSNDNLADTTAAAVANYKRGSLTHFVDVLVREWNKKSVSGRVNLWDCTLADMAIRGLHSPSSDGMLLTVD
jgi:hypothetical protein